MIRIMRRRRGGRRAAWLRHAHTRHLGRLGAGHAGPHSRQQPLPDLRFDRPCADLACRDKRRREYTRRGPLQHPRRSGLACSRDATDSVVAETIEPRARRVCSSSLHALAQSALTASQSPASQLGPVAGAAASCPADTRSGAVPPQRQDRGRRDSAPGQREERFGDRAARRLRRLEETANRHETVASRSRLRRSGGDYT